MLSVSVSSLLVNAAHLPGTVQSGQVGWLRDTAWSDCIVLLLFAFLNGAELTQHSSF